MKPAIMFSRLWFACASLYIALNLLQCAGRFHYDSATPMLQQSRVTLVTSVYDIGRKGVDGRSIEAYYTWLESLISVKAHPLVVYTSDSLPAPITNLLDRDPTISHQKLELSDLQIWSRRAAIASVLKNPHWKASIPHPEDICMRQPDYNIVQYAKFEFLLDSIQRNVYGSTHFVWIDAGITRHFVQDDLKKKAVPIALRGEKIYVGCSPSAELVQNGSRRLQKSFVGSNENVIKGMIFGGAIKAVTSLSRKTLWVLDQQMLAKNRVDNEQIAMALVLQQWPHLFRLVKSNHTVSYRWWAMFTTSVT